MNTEDKELNLIREYIILPIVISIVNKNRIEVEHSEYTLKPLYAATASVLINKMREDLEAVRRQLKDLNISVIDIHEKKDSTYLNYPYLFRGRRCQFSIRKDTAKMEVSARLNRYIKNIFASAPSDRKNTHSLT